jgi:hypothetical protein
MATHPMMQCTIGWQQRRYYNDERVAQCNDATTQGEIADGEMDPF